VDVKLNDLKETLKARGVGTRIDLEPCGLQSQKGPVE